MAQERNNTPAHALLGPFGGPKAFPETYRRALNVFINAENTYFKGDYAAADALLKKLWADVPPSSPPWYEASEPERAAISSSGLNIGSPPCYYALRMLTDCVAWRLGGGTPGEAVGITWTVVMPGHVESRQPRNRAERNKGGGKVQRLDLDPRLKENDYQIVRQATRLFIEYVAAMTGGRLKVKLRFLPLDDLTVPGIIEKEPGVLAQIDGTGRDQIWKAVPQEVKDATDWWWILYPSNVPEQFTDFKKKEFVTGGMGGGPGGGGPCFTIDDRWLLRKPPHLGHGDMHPLERRAYLPQWLQHEFFHHLFARYPEFKLEGEKGHEWFDRKTWPRDFVGESEPDYYHEALHRRLEQAKPPLHVALKYTATDLSGSITPEMLVGRYQRNPKENGWHAGELKLGDSGKPQAFRWSNEADSSWTLTADFAHQCLRCSQDSPYFNQEAGKSFLIEMQPSPKNGKPAVAGFHYNGDFYKRMGRR